MASNKKSVQKNADEKRKDQRARAWVCVVYPDSENTPEDWRNVLAESLIEVIISPLHDKDKQEEDPDKPKKAHHHVMVSFKNPSMYTKALEIFDSVGGVYPDPETAWDTFVKSCKVKDYKQMARYFCHLDQPNKHQYSISDVQTFGAIDYYSLVMSSADEDEIIDEMCEFIDKYRIDNYVAFCRYVRMEKKEWKSVLYHKSSYFIRNYITAMQWANSNGCTLEIDYEIGGSVIADLKSGAADDSKEYPDTFADKTAGQAANDGK